MTSKIAVVDLDGCIINDINPRFDSRLGMHKGPFNNLLRELMFGALNMIPYSNKIYSALLPLKEAEIDNDVIGVMKKAQEHGTIIHIVTKHKGLDTEWLSGVMANYGISIPTQNIHIVNGNKAETVNKLGTELFIDDQFDSVSKLDPHIKVRLLRRSYNIVGANLMKLLRSGQDIKIEDARQILNEV